MVSNPIINKLKRIIKIRFINIIFSLINFNIILFLLPHIHLILTNKHHLYCIKIFYNKILTSHFYLIKSIIIKKVKFVLPDK